MNNRRRSCRSRTGFLPLQIAHLIFLIFFFALRTFSLQHSFPHHLFGGLLGLALVGIVGSADLQAVALAGITSASAGTLALKVTQHSLVAGRALDAQKRRLRRGLRSDLRRRFVLRAFRCGLFPALQQCLTFMLKQLLANDSNSVFPSF
jgi:hypothetical protein